MRAYFGLAGIDTATTSPKIKPKPIVIPPSSAEEEGAAPLIAPAAWPAEVAPGASVSRQPLSAPSVSPVASPPKNSKITHRRGSPSPPQKGNQHKKKKKKPKSPPRGGKAAPTKVGNQSSADTTTEGKSTAAMVEAAEQLNEEQPADDDGHALESKADSSASPLSLTEQQWQVDIRAVKEENDLAEEEECRRLWYE